MEQTDSFDIHPETLLNALHRDHPRLMLKNPDLNALKHRAETDAVLAKFVTETIRQADEICDLPPLEYRIPDGIRLLGVSRDCVRRIYALGVAWRWTGEGKYAENAEACLLAASAFKDWNPSHFLDTAEMSHAVGVGYDWFFSVLSEASRNKIRAGLIENGLKPGLNAYAGRERYGRWVHGDNNWNQVCNGGLITGALAIAETDPDYAKQIIPAAVESLPRALKMYGPDGAWAEGPGYWGYATRYTMFGFAALETALGTDFGLLQIEGLSEAGLSPIYTAGPTGLSLNYADSGERAQWRPAASMFWLARTYQNDFIAGSEHRLIEATGHVSPQHVVWYVPPPEGEVSQPALDKRFRGPVELALFRSAWSDPNALFVGVKAGYNQASHSHLDLGNFEMDALGVRWARDLGSDNYNMPGYWGGRRGGARWQYYRLNTFSHNVPTLDGKDQDPEGTAELTRFEADGPFPFAQIDLTDAYSESADRAVRGVAVIDGRKAVLVQDEFDLKTPCEVAWGITTDASIEIIAGGEAVLTQEGKQLQARILSPSVAEFTAESAEQQPPQKANEGVSRLMVRLKGQQGSVRLTVLLAPVWADGPAEAPSVKPLAEW